MRKFTERDFARMVANAAKADAALERKNGLLSDLRAVIEAQHLCDNAPSLKPLLASIKKELR